MLEVLGKQGKNCMTKLIRTWKASRVEMQLCISQHTIAIDHTVNISKTSLIVKGRKYGMQAEIALFVQKKFYSST